jgi:UDP-N-acetyl-D-galactosamine dehydrogenase
MNANDPKRGAYRPVARPPADAGSSAKTSLDGTTQTDTTAAEPSGSTVCVVGLGYVGLPLAVAFDETGLDVVGYDIDRTKVETLRSGTDPTGGIGDDAVSDASVQFTTTPDPMGSADYVIITVPTPIDDLENPDLGFVRSAGRTIGEHVTRGTTVVLESTVYPGATEDVLAPAVEEASGLAAGVDFFLGYSPERASPGQEGRGLRDVVKVVGANDDRVRERLTELYETVVDAGVYRAPDIRTAEAAKVIENVQRDLNIALVNELAIVCERMDLSTQEVLDAAGTKWNFHDEYSPGLVGGHCIPVDPHYLAHRAEREGFSPKLILQGREINEHVPAHAAELTVKALNESGKVLRDSEVLVLGLSYKPNVGDVRTSEVSGVISGLREYDVDVLGYEPHAEVEHVRERFDVPVQSEFDPAGVDGIVLATAHDEFRSYDLDAVADEMGTDPVLMDVPSAFSPDAAAAAGFTYRRL